MPGFQRRPKQKILKNNWSLPNVVLSKNALANQTKLSTQFPTLWVTYKGEFWPNLHTKLESETALTFPSPRFRMSIAKCDFGASAFYLKKYHLSLHIFGNCVKQSRSHSHFAIRYENLAWLWPGMTSKFSICRPGMRFMPKAWESAGIN